MKKLITIYVVALLLITGVVYSQCSSDTKSNIEHSVITVSGIRFFDVNSFEELSKHSSLIVVGKVNQKFKAQKLKEHPIANTPGELEVLKVIKGDFKQNKFLRFLVSGGEITLEEYENSIKDIIPAKLEKEKLNQLDSNYKKTHYVKYVSDDYKDFEVSETYIVFLNEIGNSGQYIVVSSNGLIPITDETKITDIRSASTLFESNKK